MSLLRCSQQISNINPLKFIGKSISNLYRIRRKVQWKNALQIWYDALGSIPDPTTKTQNKQKESLPIVLLISDVSSSSRKCSWCPSLLSPLPHITGPLSLSVWEGSKFSLTSCLSGLQTKQEKRNLLSFLEPMRWEEPSPTVCPLTSAHTLWHTCSTYNACTYTKWINGFEKWRQRNQAWWQMTAIPVLGKQKQNRSSRPTWVTKDPVGRGGSPKWNVCCREHFHVKGPEASEPWEQAEPSSGLRANVGIQKWPSTLSSSGMTRACRSWYSSRLLLSCHTWHPAAPWW